MRQANSHTVAAMGFLSGDNSQGSIKAKHLCGLEHVFGLVFGSGQEELECVVQAREVDTRTGIHTAQMLCL